MDENEISPSGHADDFDNDNLGLPKFNLSGPSCQFYHRLLLYCCHFHEACLTGHPRFYKGFGLSPCVHEEYEPDPVVFPIRRRRFP